MWPKYCQYGVKPYKINQSINQSINPHSVYIDTRDLLAKYLQMNFRERWMLYLKVTRWNLTFQLTESWLNGGWMLTEGGFQSHFSHQSVTIQSTEWLAHFSDLSFRLFLKNKITPDAARTRYVRIKGKVR